MNGINSEVAVVTGGSRGIGRAVAERLGRSGLTTVVNYLSDRGAADQVVHTITAAGGAARAVPGDVADPDAVAALFDHAEALGPIRCVVVSAGVMAPSIIADFVDDDLDRHIAINIKGTLFTLREAANRVIDHGRIVTLSSTTLALNQSGYGLYNATKGAVEGVTRVLARELGPRGVTVNAVAPGPVETDLFTRGKTDTLIARIASDAPAGRLGQPADIANVVDFLASPESSWVNGQVIRVNGGIA